jgi:hypothetical protein
MSTGNLIEDLSWYFNQNGKISKESERNTTKVRAKALWKTMACFHFPKTQPENSLDSPILRRDPMYKWFWRWKSVLTAKPYLSTQAVFYLYCPCHPNHSANNAWLSTLRPRFHQPTLSLLRRARPSLTPSSPEMAWLFGAEFSWTCATPWAQSLISFDNDSNWLTVFQPGFIGFHIKETEIGHTWLTQCKKC